MHWLQSRIFASAKSRIDLDPSSAEWLGLCVHIRTLAFISVVVYLNIVTCTQISRWDISFKKLRITMTICSHSYWPFISVVVFPYRVSTPLYISCVPCSQDEMYLLNNYNKNVPSSLSRCFPNTIENNDILPPQLTVWEKQGAFHSRRPHLPKKPGICLRQSPWHLRRGDVPIKAWHVGIFWF